MGVFVSYSSRDRALLESLLMALRRAREQVWLDEELSGGEAWWREILDQIRACDVFIVALSQNLLESKACQAELRYARVLGKEILPVQVGPLHNMRINPLAQMQAIDFREPSVDTGIELVSSVGALRARARPLPDPLPDEPPIPFAYLMRLASTISDPAALSAQQQTTLVAELKAGLEEDGDEASARREISQLLAMLRDRPDVTWRTRTEVESVLAGLEPTPSAPPAPVVAPPHSDITGPQAVFARAAQPGYPPVGPPPGYGSVDVGAGQTKSTKSRTTWLLAGGVTAVAVIVAVVAVVVVSVVGDDPAPAPPPPVDRAAMGDVLLTASEIESVVGVPDLTATDVMTRMDDTAVTMSDPNCTGVLGTAIASVYADSDYLSVRDQAFSRDDPPYWLAQTVVLFGSAAEARDALTAMADRWERCASETVAVASENGEERWAVGELERGDDRLVQQAAIEAGAGYACQHAVRVRSNVVVESVVCHDDLADDAARVVDRLVADIPA